MLNMDLIKLLHILYSKESMTDKERELVNKIVYQLVEESND
jgi:hypothetical protein